MSATIAQTAAARITHAASFACGGMVGRTASSSAVGGVLSGLPRYFLMRSPSLLSSLAQSFATFAMSTTVRGLPVLASSMVTLPVRPRASRARARSCSGPARQRDCTVPGLSASPIGVSHHARGTKLVPFHRLSPHKHRYERSGLDVAVHTPEAGNDFNDYKCGNAHRVAIGIAPIC